MIELATARLAAGPEPFLVPVRTVDALHLASIVFLLGRGLTVRLASCGERLLAAAKALKISAAAI